MSVDTSHTGHGHEHAFLAEHLNDDADNNGFAALGGAGARNGRAQAAFEHDDISETAEAVTEGVKNVEAQKAGNVNLAGGAELELLTSLGYAPPRGFAL